MQIYDLPIDLQYEILSYLPDVSDQISALRIYPAWSAIFQRLFFTSKRYESRVRTDYDDISNKYFIDDSYHTYALHRYKPDYEKVFDPTRHPRVHKLLLHSENYRLSCTIRSGIVECYKLVFVPHPDDETYDAWDITDSPFLDEPAFLPPEPNGSQKNHMVQPLLGITKGWITGEEYYINLSKLEFTTVRKTIEALVMESRSDFKGKGMKENIRQEMLILFSTFNTSLGKEDLAMVLGTLIRRPIEEYKTWLRADQRARRDPTKGLEELDHSLAEAMGPALIPEEPSDDSSSDDD